MDTAGKSEKIVYESIGTIRTPYTDWAPFYAPEKEAEEGLFRIELKAEYAEGLKDLDTFKFIYVLFHFDRSERKDRWLAHPPSLKGGEVGTFASRSQRRPNGIGLSIVKLQRIEGNTIYIGPIEAFDGTPLLDLKPYFGSSDAKKDAGDGWFDKLEDKEHQLMHMMGISHDHDDHDHGHGHGHGHDHEH